MNPPGAPGPPALGRRYWSLWAAATCSAAGNGLNFVALPLLAATLTRRPLSIAAVLFVSRLPWLIVAIPAGAYADRADRPALMRSMDLVRALLFAALATLVATSDMTMTRIYLFALGVGVCDTFFAGSTQAVLPAIVERTRLESANGLLSVGGTAAEQTIGPGVGGLLFAWAPAVPFAADALSFVGSAAFLLGLGRTPRTARTDRGRAATGATARRRLWTDIRAGMAWYRQSRVLRLVTGAVAVLSFSQAMVSGILVLFALERLHLHEIGFGIFMAGVAVGNVLGGMVAARLVRRLGTSTVVIAAILLAAAGYLAAGTTSSPYLAAGCLSIEAVAVTVGNVATISLRQRLTPADLQARVGNVWRTVVWGVIPFGALAGGALGADFGLRVPFFVAGGLQLVLGVVVARPLGRLLQTATGPSARRPDPVVG